MEKLTESSVKGIWKLALVSDIFNFGRVHCLVSGVEYRPKKALINKQYKAKVGNFAQMCQLLKFKVHLKKFFFFTCDF